MRVLTISLLASFVLNAVADDSTRTWTSTNGSTVFASVFSHTSSNVTLKTEDGRRLEVKRASLSYQDQNYLLLQDGAKYKNPDVVLSLQSPDKAYEWVEFIKWQQATTTNPVLVVTFPTPEHMSAWTASLPAAFGNAANVKGLIANKFTAAKSGKAHWFVGSNRSIIEQISEEWYKTFFYDPQSNSFPVYFTKDSLEAMTRIPESDTLTDALDYSKVAVPFIHGKVATSVDGEMGIIVVMPNKDNGSVEPMPSPRTRSPERQTE